MGIAVGVMLISSLLLIMDGLETSISDSVEILSGNLIVQKEGSIDLTASIVNISLVDTLKKNPDIKAISPEIHVGKRLDDAGLIGFLVLIGITESYDELVSQSYIKYGKIFNENETEKATIGIKLAEQLNIGLDDTLIIESFEFKIDGIFETNTLIDSTTLLVPISDARKLSGLPKEVVNIIEIRPVSPDRAKAIKEYVESEFDGIEVIFPQELLEEGQEIMATLRGVIWTISSIAVIIGGIGIANTMLMSVLERTPEIGVLKATGWSNFNVSYSIVLESIGIGIIGGLIGITLGISASLAAQEFIPNLPVQITLLPLSQSFLFAIGLSVLSGIYPAIKAARISPIAAIKGE
jgi:putative ABC transport system permease protein